VPIIFADDINFAIRGFDMAAMVEQANALLAIVRKWAIANDVPMAKLQASWLTGGYVTQAKTWAGGDVIYDAALRCTPGVAPIKLLGVTYDEHLNFDKHVDNVLAQCEVMLRFLRGMKSVVKAEKLVVLYRGLILSRLLYAVDAWYPFTNVAARERIESMHRRGCCVITGAVESSHRESVCYEAGFRDFEETARDEITGIADKMRRMSDGCAGGATTTETCFGPAWVVRLFRDYPMPTAAAAPRATSSSARRRGRTPAAAPAAFPPPNWAGRLAVPDSAQTLLSLRDVGVRLDNFNLPDADDPRELNEKGRRPLSRIHPFAPHELALFDKHVRFINSPPGGLTKAANFDTLSDEELELEKLRLAAANAQRISDLVRDYGADALFTFTDGSRCDGKEEATAAAYVGGIGPDPKKWRGKPRIKARTASASPISCVYSAELLSKEQALRQILRDFDELLVRPDKTLRNVVLITDCKSSLDAERTTWLRRIGHREQTICRLLYELALRGVTVVLAFVFSHVGGADGNELVDEVASRALGRYHDDWSDPLWYVDSTRRMLHHQHDLVDKEMAEEWKHEFRFRHCDEDRPQPSAPLPRSMSRADEILVYRARLGMMTQAGGFLHGRDDPCPLCDQRGALGRYGKTIDHLVRCAPRTPRTGHGQTRVLKRDEFSSDMLWSDPTQAALALNKIVAEIAARKPRPLATQTETQLSQRSLSPRSRRGARAAAPAAPLTQHPRWRAEALPSRM
jgi:hypothetical protein